jgi:serine/threonine-protein kinase RsbW
MRRLVAVFNDFAETRNLPATPRHDLYVALDEILSNMVKHRRRNRGRLWLDLSLDEGALRATVRDNSEPFNPLEQPLPATDQPLLERPIGGLGILLVTELMDEVAYERQGGRNCVRLKKQLD